MLEFEFDAELLPLRYHKPALPALFQLPPQLRTTPRRPISAARAEINALYFVFQCARGSARPLALPLKEV